MIPDERVVFVGGQPFIDKIINGVIHNLDPEYETKCAKLKLHELYVGTQNVKKCNRCCAPYVPVGMHNDVIEFVDEFRPVSVCGKIHKHGTPPCTLLLACNRPWCRLATVPICTLCKTAMCDVKKNINYDPMCDWCGIDACVDCSMWCDGCYDHLCNICAKPYVCKDEDNLRVIGCAACVVRWDHETLVGLREQVRIAHESHNNQRDDEICRECDAILEGPAHDEGERLSDLKRDELQIPAHKRHKK
jgi:hypothetical protein